MELHDDFISLPAEALNEGATAFIFMAPDALIAEIQRWLDVLLPESPYISTPPPDLATRWRLAETLETLWPDAGEPPSELAFANKLARLPESESRLARAILTPLVPSIRMLAHQTGCPAFAVPAGWAERQRSYLEVRLYPSHTALWIGQ